jgi:hypothetical protein
MQRLVTVAEWYDHPKVEGSIPTAAIGIGRERENTKKFLNKVITMQRLVTLAQW